MKRKEAFGIMVFVGFLMLAFAPMGYVNAAISGGHIVANYVVVPQSNGKDWRPIVRNSIGEARGYVFRGINGANGYRVAFVELVRYNSDWRMDSNGYSQYIMAHHGENFVYCNDYGAFSPYPRNGGKGYNNFPNDIHNGIGTDMGAFVDVSDSMKYDNWYVYQGNYSNLHWIYHEYKGGEENGWDYTAVGGAFYFGSSTHQLEFTIVKWKVVSGWWIFETHKDMLNGQIIEVYLNTS